MNWKALDEFVPKMRFGADLHVDRLTVGRGEEWKVDVLQPGKYMDRTAGGDFVVRVTSPQAGWEDHAFTHVDLFEDAEAKRASARRFTWRFLAATLVSVIGEGADPASLRAWLDERRPAEVPGLEPVAFLTSAQSLALAEHRRYRRFEEAGGGRCLPTKYALGIIDGLWTSEEAADEEKSGLPGLRKLRREHGRERSFRQALGRRLVNPCPCAQR